MFITVLLVGWGLIAAQEVASYYDGFLYQQQLLARYIKNGYAFVEHGGMWADTLIISPIVAFIVSQYQLQYFSIKGISLLVVMIALFAFAGYQYQQVAMNVPEAHTHDGHTTIAGMIHLFYAIMTAWVIILFIISPLNLKINTYYLLVMSVLLSIWAVMGVMKFSSRWSWDKNTISQVTIEICLIFMAIGIRLKLQY